MESTLSLDLRVFRSLEELADRASEWNALVNESETNTIYQTFEWHASWLCAFGHRVEPLILVVEEQNELVRYRIRKTHLLDENKQEYGNVSVLRNVVG